MAFSNNNARDDGGAGAVRDNSIMLFGEHSTVIFSRNSALNEGGAFFAM